jgi:hypothetical protein
MKHTKDRSEYFLFDIKGSSNVLIICTTMAIILISAFATDIGYVSFESLRLSKAAEAAAEAGAEELACNGGDAENIIRKVLLGKISHPNVMDIRISDSGREISVHLQKNIGFKFLSALGVKERQLKTDVTVKISGVKAVKGTRPVAVSMSRPEYGRQYVLVGKRRAESGAEIPFLPIAMGKESYRADIAHGSMKELIAGDEVTAFTGDYRQNTVTGLNSLIEKCSHSPRCTYLKYEADCPRIIIIPVVDRLDMEGANNMKIMGFAAFFTEGCNVEEGEVRITGRFIRHTARAVTSDDAPDFGLLGVNIEK